MPVTFEELQELWQSQRQPAVAAVDSRGMTDALSRFGRRQNLINTLKAAVVVWQVWSCLSRLGVSVLTVAGEAAFLVGVASVLMSDWRHQLGIVHLDFARPSAGFVDTVLARLRDPNAPLRRRMWLNIVLIGAGVNLLFAEGWAGSTPQQRILHHLAATLFPAAAYLLGFKIRSMRYGVEYRPLMVRLTAMKRALREQSQ